MAEKDYRIAKYYALGYSYDGLTKVKSRENDKYGYIDNSGNLVIPCIYNFATNFSEGYAIVKDNEHSKIINTKGEVITILEDNVMFLSTTILHNGLIRIARILSATVLYNYINVKGEELLSSDVSYASDFSDGLALIYINNIDEEPIIIDTKGNHHPELLEEYHKTQKTTPLDLKIDNSGFKNGLLKIDVYNFDKEIIPSLGYYIYKDGRVFHREKEIDSLYNFTMPQYLKEKSVNPNNDLLHKFFTDITYLGKRATLSADTKEELQEKKKAFYQRLETSLNLGIYSKNDDDQAKPRKF